MRKKTHAVWINLNQKLNNLKILNIPVKLSH